jgi:hypothetical protein
MIDANLYAYPVITDAVMFLAALLDSIQARRQACRWRHAVPPGLQQAIQVSLNTHQRGLT